MNRGILVLLIAVGGILYLSLKSHIVEIDVPREKLSASINSEFQEVRPLISADGTRLYFSRRNHPDNTGGSKDFQDIWQSDFQNGAWTTPTRLPKPLNNKKANTLCSITSDGRYALLLDSYKRVKTPLAQVFHSSAGWTAPGDLLIHDFINLSSYYDFYYHEQAQVILSAIDNGRGSGEQDLHVSFKKDDGSYTKPKNLGKVINTRKSDFAPFLASDGRTLYFSSYGHSGMGGSDFYVCYRLDDSWLRWTEPKNLGPGINSSNDENFLSVTADFSYVYFESYPENSKEKDLYRAPLPRQFHPENLNPKNTSEPPIASRRTSETAPELNYNPIVEPNSPTGEPLSSLPKSPTALAGLASTEYHQDGQTRIRILNNSYFQYNSFEISPEFRTKLKEISTLLVNNPSIQAQLEGHTDNRGTVESNLRISYLRAQAAAHFLVDQGVSGNQLLVVGAGEQAPLASNDDEREGRELNRRVEVTLISPVGISDL